MTKRNPILQRAVRKALQDARRPPRRPLGPEVFAIIKRAVDDATRR